MQPIVTKPTTKDYSAFVKQENASVVEERQIPQVSRGGGRHGLSEENKQFVAFLVKQAKGLKLGQWARIPLSEGASPKRLISRIRAWRRNGHIPESFRARIVERDLYVQIEQKAPILSTSNSTPKVAKQAAQGQAKAQSPAKAQISIPSQIPASKAVA